MKLKLNQIIQLKSKKWLKVKALPWSRLNLTALNCQTSDTIVNNVEDDQKNTKFLVRIEKKQENIEKSLNYLETECSNEPDKQRVDKCYGKTVDIFKKLEYSHERLFQMVSTDKIIMYTFMIRMYEKFGPEFLKENKTLINYLNEEINWLNIIKKKLKLILYSLSFTKLLMRIYKNDNGTTFTY